MAAAGGHWIKQGGRRDFRPAVVVEYNDVQQRITAMERDFQSRRPFDRGEFDALLARKEHLAMTSPALKAIRPFIKGELEGSRRGVDREWLRQQAMSAGALWGGHLGVDMRAEAKAAQRKGRR